jgi:hypothetical protein
MVFTLPTFLGANARETGCSGKKDEPSIRGLPYFDEKK